METWRDLRVLPLPAIMVLVVVDVVAVVGVTASPTLAWPLVFAVNSIVARLVVAAAAAIILQCYKADPSTSSSNRLCKASRLHQAKQHWRLPPARLPSASCTQHAPRITGNSMECNPLLSAYDRIENAYHGQMNHEPSPKADPDDVVHLPEVGFAVAGILRREHLRAGRICY